MSALKIGIFCVLLGGTTALLMHRHKGNEQLAAEIETLRGQNAEITVLQPGNQRRVAAASEHVDAERGKRGELRRLQGQIVTLRKQTEKMEQQRAAATVQSRPSAGLTPSVMPPPGTMLVESMQNVGRATPALAMQTGFWAQSRGDVQTILDGLAFEPAGKAKLDALFGNLSAAEQAHFGSPERLAAILVAGTMPNLGGGPGTPVQMVETSRGPETAEVTLRVPLPNGSLKDVKTVRFRQHPDGWKAVLPAGEAEILRDLLHGLPPSQRMRLGGN